MKRYPQIRTLSAIARELRTPTVSTEADVYVSVTGPKMRGYVPARGEGFASLEQRVRAAWLVFTGKADAVTWPEDDGFWIQDDAAPVPVDPAELEALRRDAARYRWLRTAQHAGHFDSGYAFKQSPDEFDAAVDNTKARIVFDALAANGEKP